MNSKIQEGYILLADISGFEAYVTHVEMDHAQGVLDDLLQRLMDRLISPFHLASLEGGAVLCYLPLGVLLRGETLLELLEVAYTDFLDHLKNVYRNTTCTCQACLSIPTLNLKFMIHYGQYIEQSAPSGTILIGPAVQLIRSRLLKDQVSQEQRAYALFTQAGLDQLGVHPAGTHMNQQTYPDYGEVKTARLDLQPRYQAALEARRVAIGAPEADLHHVCDINVSAPELWEWLNEPTQRNRWMKDRRWSAIFRPGGRTGIGARNHCMHGRGGVEETVLDWRPFDYFTVEAHSPSAKASLCQTYRLHPLEEGKTRLEVYTRIQQPGGLMKLIAKAQADHLFRADYERLRNLIEVAPPA
jgi:hypothetical protein